MRARRVPSPSTGRRMRALVSLLAVLVLGSCSAASRATHPADSSPAPPTSGSTAGSPGQSPASTTPSAQVTNVTATTLSVRLPAPASRVVTVAAGGHVLVLGGLVAGTTSAQVLRLDPAAAKITAAGRLAHATHDAGGAVLGGSAFVFGGGVQASADWVQSVPVAGGVGALVGRLPTPRSDLVVVSDGTTAYIVGGYATGSGLTDVLATADGTTFHVVAHLVMGVRYAAAALVGGALWVVGGEHDGAQVDTVQRVDLTTGIASVVGHLAAPLSHASATVLDGTLLVVGGLSAGKHLDAIERLDTATGAMSLVGHLPSAASDTAVAVLGDAAYVVGGETSAAGSNHPLDTVVQLTTGPASATQ